MSQLSTPTINAEDTLLTISNIDDNATSVQLKRDGTNYKNLFVINDTYTNVTASEHVGLIGSDETVTISLSADGTNYKLPDTVSVAGATGTYTRTSDTVGSLVLSNCISNISFIVSGEPMMSEYSVVVTGQGDVRIYDGISASGTYLGGLPGTYTITSGNMYITLDGGTIWKYTVSGGVSYSSKVLYESITFNVSNDGTLELIVQE